MLRLVTTKDIDKYIIDLEKRSEGDYTEIDNTVRNIIKEVRVNKDKALLEFTEKFDNVKLDNIKVTKEEIRKAYETIDKELLEIIKESASNIKDYHSKELAESFIYDKNKDIKLGRIITAIEKVGIYIPGGKALYPSSVLMNAIPAKIAGVKELSMVTPPKKDGTIQDSLLVAADICGVDNIYKLGGAQSIAALAYGTETVTKVYKITGPGNAYVASAKRQVFGKVGIDMVAGPSEIMVVANKNANPKYIAADLLSQAEHDENAASILITDNKELVKKVNIELDRLTNLLPKKEIIKKSLSRYGTSILVDDFDKVWDIVNEIAPEHLELLTDNPLKDSKKVYNAGAIFLGEYTPEPIGDYFAGPNHTLPTNQTSKFYSALSVNEFRKQTSLINYNQNALKDCGKKVIKFAQSEELDAHALSIKVRLEDIKC